MMGTSIPASSMASRTAASAALAFSASNTVSIKKTSTPPSIKARAAWEIAGGEFIEADTAKVRVARIRRQRRTAVGGPQYTGHEARPAGLRRDLVRRAARQPRRREIQLGASDSNP